jgi:molybdate transport system substrate-binding protein
MHQNYDLEDRLLNYSARIIREEKSGLNPLALGLRCWKLDVERWKFACAIGPRLRLARPWTAPVLPPARRGGWRFGTGSHEAQSGRGLPHSKTLAFGRFPVVLGTSIICAVALVSLLYWQPAAPGSGSRERTPLVIYCAAGMRPPVEVAAHDYERQFGVPVQVQYGGSGTLLANIRVTKVGDLFVCADNQTTELARKQDLIAEVVPLAHIRPVIAFRKGNLKGIHCLADLWRDDMTLSLANPDAASIGKTTRAALEKTGQWDQVRSHIRVFKPTVGDVANDIKLGTVDAGVIWDATAYQNPELETLRIPLFDQAAETVAVGVLKCSPHPTEALRLARYLAARDQGLQQFSKHGYEPVDGDAWAERPELVLYSGAMNRPAVEETIRKFEQREGVRVTRVYNGCGILVAQMKAGARPDAYLTCDKSFVPPVADLFPENAVELSDAAIVLLVAKGNPKNLSSLRDLAQAGLRVGIANAEQSTLGALTRQLLEQEGIFDKVTANVVTQVPTADLLVNQMRTGALDASIVYISNTMLVRSQLDVVDLTNRQALAIQTFSVNKDSRFKQLSARLLASLQSKESRARYEAAGFHWRADENPAQTSDAQ